MLANPFYYVYQYTPFTMKTHFSSIQKVNIPELETLSTKCFSIAGSAIESHSKTVSESSGTFMYETYQRISVDD